MSQRRPVLLAQFSVLLAAGILSGMALAGCGGDGAGGSVAAAVTTGVRDRSTATSTVERTVTATQPTTVRETQTQQQTVTTGPTIISPNVTTTAPSTSSSGETPNWAWALIVVLGLGVVALIVVLLVRRRGPEEMPLEQRRQLVAASASSWVAQGWAIESQTDDTAILQREDQHMLISVDSRGRVTSGPLGPPQQ
jgi:hypothetical protein